MLSGMGILGATTVGSLAYTTASVSRAVTSNIAADSSAIIALNPGGVAAVTENSDGQMVIDTGTSKSNGLNGDASFTYGDAGSPKSTFAFSVTNNDGSSHVLTVSLTGMTVPGNSTFEIEFFDDGGTSVGTATPSADFTYDPWASTETLYAVITIDTTDATSSDDFSGTVTFSA